MQTLNVAWRPSLDGIGLIIISVWQNQAKNEAKAKEPGGQRWRLKAGQKENSIDVEPDNWIVYGGDDFNLELNCCHP